MEYCDKKRASNETLLMYSQSCHYYREQIQKPLAVMNIRHKPGELIEVYCACQTMPIADCDIGGVHPANFFVAIFLIVNTRLPMPSLSKDGELD